MSKIRVHELAKELGRQNKEVIECLKSGGVDEQCGRSTGGYGKTKI